MDITPIYELRTRLRAAAIAGTNLISEDFRLKRAAEAIQPLEAASPVFAKIGGLIRELLAPGQENKEGLLLDAITLVDALLCTQGEVAVAEEITPLPIHSKGSVVSNAPYSDVKALLDALTNSGGGRYSYLQQMHESRPELFEDYRVKPALVHALGASYAELAEDVEKWLKEMGESLLPLLEKDFDPRGKKEMLRRVEVIDAIAGAKANDFYLGQLPDSEKEIRQALIFALRHSPENEELLLSLVKTEKGRTKKMAYYALACQESREAGELLESLLNKKPEEALAALSVSRTDWAAELVQKSLCELSDKIENKIKKGERLLDESASVKDDLNVLGMHLEALKGKNSTTVCACCRRAASLAEVPEVSTLKAMLAGRLRDYLLVRPDGELASLAVELYEIYGGSPSGEEYFPAAALAKMLTAEDCTEWLQKELDRDKKSILPEKLYQALHKLCWNEQGNSWAVRDEIYSMAFDTLDTCICEVKQKVKGSFTQFIMGLSAQKMGKWEGLLDLTLADCIPDGDREYENMIMEYLYRKALRGTGHVSDYCLRLKQHHFPKCEGLAAQYFKKKDSIYMWEITNFFTNILPGGTEAKREEGRALLKLIKRDLFGNKKRHLNMEQLETYLENLE